MESRGHPRIRHQKISSLRSNNMQGLLQLFFCFVLLAKGSCLQCEICQSNMTSCKGAKQNCSEENTCITTVMNSTLGESPEYLFEKSCGKPSVCNMPQLHFDLGKGQGYHLTQHCCKKKDCPEISPTLPPLPKHPKGKRCPACNSLRESCKSDKVECLGKDSYCFTVTLNVTSGGKHTKHIMKGCGSKNVCLMWEDAKDKEKTQNKCMMTAGASQVLASFLTTFFSLWILKLLV